MSLGLATLAGAELVHEVVRHLPRRNGHAYGVCLVLDADRTLSIEDTGRSVGAALGLNDQIRSIFERLGYEDDAFSAVSAVWSAVDVSAYSSEIERVAESVALRDCWQQILGDVLGEVPVVVLTAGIPQIWRKVLERHGFLGVPVLGGSHSALDDYVVSARAKGDVVRALRDEGWLVLAAGDSCVDLPMLAAADAALFVPDSKGSPALRAALTDIKMASVRHLIVDEQRFDDLDSCLPSDVPQLIFQGGMNIAN